ncbi:hypothetical protein OS128_05145 [Corynebacterium sp. P5848]|uniref:hypothetical protein n=1 Tax=Corynebacterium marambiense TaxID=2765364 RepID=UPI002260C92F|nr:hypothetical protein [Corynebacterium marambiense]MCX7542296.1 hypothetical protein [Corynebacterium marambiense]
MLAEIADTVAVVSWQLSGDPKIKPPERLPRPGVEKPQEPETEDPSGPFGADESGTFRGVETPIDELNEWLGWTADDPEPETEDRALTPAPVLGDQHGPHRAITDDVRDQARADYRAGGFTYADLAEKYGVAPSTIGRWARASTP